MGCLILVLLVICGGLAFGVGIGKVKVPCLPLVCQATSPRSTPTATATATPDLYKGLLDLVTLDCNAFGHGDANSLWPRLTPRFQQQFGNNKAAFAQSLQQHPGVQFVSCTMDPKSITINGSNASAGGDFKILVTASGNTQNLTIRMTLARVNGQWLLDAIQVS